MSRLNLPLPPQLSSVPGIDRDALAWAALFKDQLERWGNGQLLYTGTTPPPSPTTGDRWVFPADTTNGVYWEFQYDNSQTTYKWVFVGGGPMSHEILTDETTVSTTYVDLATVGPTLTLPRAGDYEVQFGAELYNSAVTNSTAAAIKRGAAATSDNDAIQVNSPGASFSERGARTIIVTGMAASDVVKVQYKASAGTSHALRRGMTIRPVRVI